MCSRVKVEGQGEGQTLAICFCTICAQVALVLCEPLQVVALKTKVYWLLSLTLCQRRACPGSRPLLLLVQRFLFALLQNLDTAFHSCAFLPQSWGFPGYPSLCRSSPA